jgi:hypothetical protein
MSEPSEISCLKAAISLPVAFSIGLWVGAIHCHCGKAAKTYRGNHSTFDNAKMGRLLAKRKELVVPYGVLLMRTAALLY